MTHRIRPSGIKFTTLAMLALWAEYAAAQAPVHSRLVTQDEFTDALAPEQRIRMDIDAERNIAQLADRGLLAQPKVSTIPIADLQWPLRSVPGFEQFDYHGTKNFVDHDSRFPGFTLDYQCGSRTYDLASGYNHAGTDYYLWPFPWLMMDQGDVEIVAAAPGILTGRADGNFDRNCAIASSTDPNFVRLLQDDGLTAIYLHMRNGSVTNLPIGAHVAAGDYLGTVGSSGQSSGPHLHFELRDANGTVIDPRHGQCNETPDRWTVFQPYEDPHIDSLSTHAAEPNQIVCGYVGGKNFQDTPNYKTVFAPGDALWVFASYRDQRDGQVTQFTILRPDGSVFQNWPFDPSSQNNPLPFYSGSAYDWQYTLPADAPTGVWTITAVFQGQTYTRTFVVSKADRPPVIGGYLSGNWFNPSEGGSGFQLEATTDNMMVAIWFVYTPDGSGQNWIFAQGSYDATKSSVTLPAFVLTGARFPPNFNSADITRTSWGTLTFSFADCNNATAMWSSTMAGYGSGSLPITRLTQIAGTTCPR